jgi:chromosome segregation ATPase
MTRSELRAWRAERDKEIRELKESLATKDERAAAREREIEAKSAEVRKLRRQWQTATPDQQIEELRRDASAAAFDVRIKVAAQPSHEGEDVSSLRTRASALVQAGIAAGIDQTVYLAGLFAEVERDIAALRDELGIPVASIADPAAEAAAWDDRPVGQVR